jgi:tetratricopeptide (TPR) repeat protein
MPRLAPVLSLFVLCASLHAQIDEPHRHPAPEKLGKVDFAVSCTPAVRATFNRGIALLHSFAYEETTQAFQQVAQDDPRCAMAQWGIAASYIHPLWEPALEPGALERGRAAIAEAQRLGTASPREQHLITALGAYFSAPEASGRQRALAYEVELAKAASAHPRDPEVQIFYALSMLATASPSDATHAQQKRAAAILEPLRRRMPRHPGIVHYLIHAYDSQELAKQGLSAAREYSKIAPSAPHALHMPSHTFTRLGLWEESIASNRAARKAAEEQGDIGEVLHSMDYLMYAYLQSGRTTDAAALLQELQGMMVPPASTFKIGYAASAMPARYAMEQQRWSEAAALHVPKGARPEVAATTLWAKSVALARLNHVEAARDVQRELEQMREELRRTNNVYWTALVGFQADEAQAWIAYAAGNTDEAIRQLRSTADAEDALEKLPMTPGPVIPAREQLGEMLAMQSRHAEALREFEGALRLAPQRRNALAGALRAAEALKDGPKVKAFRAALR